MNVKRLAIMYVGGSEDDRGFVKDEAPKLTDEEFAQLVENVRKLEDGEVTLRQMERQMKIEECKERIINGELPRCGTNTVASICIGRLAHSGDTLVFVRYEKPGAQIANVCPADFDGEVKIVWQWRRHCNESQRKTNDET